MKNLRRVNICNIDIEGRTFATLRIWMDRTHG
jgi:hypothetical protein